MIDYLVKLLTDKPIITYLEDPLASSEIASWTKLTVIYFVNSEKNKRNISIKKS
jgi:enolase